MSDSIDLDGEHSHATTDRETIEEWAESRGAEPATVEGTADEGQAGVLRLRFPDTRDDHENLSAVSWDAFFEKFERESLAFVYQTTNEAGNTSRFYKIVDRETVREG